MIHIRPWRRNRFQHIAILLACVACLCVSCKKKSPAPAKPEVRKPARVQRPLPYPVKPFRMGEPDLILLVTGGTDGTLELCNCPGYMPGGLARRSTLVERYRKAFPRVFVLDTGDAFATQPRPGDPRNEFLLKGYAAIGYDAVVLSDQEWAIPPAQLKPLLTPSPPVYLSTTIDPAKKVTLPLVKVVERNYPALKSQPALQLAVLSDIRPQAFAFLPEAVRNELRFLPQILIAQQVAMIRKQNALLVISPHGLDSDIAATARNYRPDLILAGHAPATVEKIQYLDNIPVIRVRGTKHVGVVAIKLATALAGKGKKIGKIEYRVETVDQRWALDKKLVNIYQAYSHVAMRNAQTATKTLGLSYVPSASCRRCHKPQYNAWKKSRHARAWATLVKEKKTGDPSCVYCHTSGFGTKKGFRSHRETPKLANVNCQDCHALSLTAKGKHPKGFPKKSPPPRVTQSRCLICHTKVTDPKFQFPQRLHAIKCPPQSDD